MTDNQLLFEAAKAAGIDFSIKGQVPTRFDGKDFIVWNPLTNDGDALRLAVKLRMAVEISNRKLVWVSSENLQHVIEIPFSETSDPYAATRRAIVRAAVEVGEEMK